MIYLSHILERLTERLIEWPSLLRIRVRAFDHSLCYRLPIEVEGSGLRVQGVGLSDTSHLFNTGKEQLLHQRGILVEHMTGQ